MKSKFSSMLRVSIALVLALSLGLMAAPAAADVSGITVTPDPTTAETAAEYTVVFTTTAYLMEGTSDKIYIEFPADTDIAGYDGDVTIEGAADAGVTVNGQILEIQVPGSGGDIEPGSVTVILTTSGATDITNPEAGDYTLDVWTNEEPTHVESNPYTITPVVDTTPPNAVTVGAPDGGETWAAGSTKSITWSGGDDAIDSATTIKLEYSDDAGSSWNDITTLADTSLTGYSWTVPSVDSTNCLVKVTATDDAANSVSDVSDAEFTIDSALPTVAVTAPNGGEVWVESSSHDITWTCTDTDLVANPIDIDYSADGGTTWTRVATSVANSGTHSWATLPAVYSTNCLVKVTATDDAANSGSDVSNAVFTIDDATLPNAVTLNAPDGGENWAAGSTQSISWSGGDDVIDSATTIKLEYSADAGSNWSDITTLADTADTSYSWTVPSIDSANCLVKIMATDDAANSVSVVSDAVFTIAAATEVWVDDDGNDLYPGTEALPFETIQEGIDQSGVDGTVNVLPGTYTLAVDGTIIIETAGVTLRSTGTAAETIIDADALTGSAPADGSGIYIKDVAGVTVDGFTVENASACGIYLGDADDAIIQNNVVTEDTSDKGGIDVSHMATGVRVLDNELNEYSVMILHGSNCTLSRNIFGNSINFQPQAGETLEGVTITDNTFPAPINNTVNGAINLWGGASASTINDSLIEGNDLSNRDLAGIRIGSTNPTTLTVTNLTITGNDITNNAEAGIKIYANLASWGTSNTINNNNISGNILFGIDNGIATIIDAENNWWGDASGPYVVNTNPDGMGDEVTTAVVDYRPWLLAPFAETVAPTIDLAAGWNFISVPKRMADDTDSFGELLDGISVVVAYSYDPVNGWSLPLTDATPVEVLEGYWIDVTTAGTVTLSYKETAQEVPASKSLVGDAWNAIGFSSTTARDADEALKSIEGSWSTVLGWDAEGQAYEDSIIAGTTGDMLPGKGYWIWMTEEDVLSAISG